MNANNPDLFDHLPGMTIVQASCMPLELTVPSAHLVQLTLDDGSVFTFTIARGQQVHFESYPEGKYYVFKVPP